MGSHDLVKQVVINKSGDVLLVDVPAPRLRPGFVLVRTRYSLVSAGTEGAQLREGQASLLEKAREHPEQVKQVLSKVRREGVKSVMGQVQDKLSEWRPLGYSLSGQVLAVGDGVTDLGSGDAVACAGAGYAVHAEEVAVPRNLVAKLPAGADFRGAAFVTLGAIALHGVRRAAPTLGENALVVGLGLVGQLTAQWLKLSGVRVAVSDPEPGRTRMALDLGADLVLSPEQDPAAQIAAWTGGFGVDLVLLTAATASSEPVRLASRLLRDRGRIVVVGDVGLELERGPFYMKELDFSISRSYGPGRYDPSYEEGGVDYPVGFVRWTEGRNLEAAAEFLAAGRLRVADLVSEELPLDEAPAALRRIAEGGGSLGTLIRYPAGEERSPAPATLNLRTAPPVSEKVGVLLVGTGWFARNHRLPALRSCESLRLAGVVSATGTSARQLAEKGGGTFATTSYEEGLARPEVEAVILATRHNLHVPQAVAAIRAGKHVLVEKPLALDVEGLRSVARALREHPVRFAVGFNRRHAPLAAALRDLLAGRSAPIHGVYRMHAGRLPREHWVNDPVVGGGRLLGEACHAFDFLNFLTGSPPVSVHATRIRSGDAAVKDDDNVTATVSYADGSVLSVLYTTAGPEGFSKEEIEVFTSGLAAKLVDFRDLVWTGARKGRKALRTPDKGLSEELIAWARHLRGEATAVADFPAAAVSTWLTLRALESARTGVALPVADTLFDALGG
jgi:predicted dehydrogenase/threonine dehydrogenase-like Zn-dependent dehydrogenase